MALSIEAAPEVQQRVCPDCGLPFSSVHGFVYEDGDAYAVYQRFSRVSTPRRS